MLKYFKNGKETFFIQLNKQQQCIVQHILFYFKHDDFEILSFNFSLYNNIALRNKILKVDCEFGFLFITKELEQIDITKYFTDRFYKYYEEIKLDLDDRNKNEQY